MGKNRKWVLEDNLSEAVWRTILDVHARRPHRHPIQGRAVHPRSPQRSRSSSFEARKGQPKGEGLLPKTEFRRERKVHHSPQPGHCWPSEKSILQQWD